MPVPLFPMVWQYQNQTIDVLANDIATLMSNTQGYIPASNGTGFSNSPLYLTPQGIDAEWNGVMNGLSFNFVAHKYGIGDITGPEGTLMYAQNAAGVAHFYSNFANNDVQLGISGSQKTLTCRGVMANVAGALNGKYLQMQVDGVPYKIPLHDI